MTFAAGTGGPRRVLLTADAVGGVWTYALDLARGLADGGACVTLAVLGPTPDAGRRAEAAAAPGLELVETGLPLDWTAGDRAELRTAALGLAALAGRVGADLVHLNSPALAGLARFPAPVVGVAHSDVRTWWEAVETGPLPPDLAWRAALLAEGYAACDLLLAPTAAFAAATDRAYGLAPRVVWNGRAQAAEAPAPAQRRRCVITAGRLWDAGKNVATLDAAAAQLDWPVHAYGPTRGPQGQGVALRGLRPGGSVDSATLRAALGEAQVFSSVALYEPFGLAVLEAAQAGCALVLSDIPPFRELWDGAALFTPPRDAEALAAAWRGLLADEAAVVHLAAAARARAERYRLEPFVAGVRAAHAEASVAKRRAAA